jgi:hypothetical protein
MQIRRTVTGGLLAAVLLPAMFGAGPFGGQAWAHAAGPRPTRAVGVTLDTGPGGPAQAFALFTSAGANGLEAPQPWSVLEPAPGHFRLGDVSSLVAGIRSTPATSLMFIPAAIETTQRSVPAGLRHAPWASRRMIGAYRRLIDRAAVHLSRQVRFISIANEADVYLSSHPRQTAGFIRFAQTEIRELRRRVPGAKVGVTVTFSGLISAHPQIARRLARLGNATILTYYPLGAGYRPRSPRSPTADIPTMVRLARGRPLVIQEAGYPSARTLHSSPARQATFVKAVFAAWNRHPRAIPFLSFYTLFDAPARDCATAGRVPSLAFLCSLGLHDRDGRPKPAWPAFTTGVRSVR